MFEVGPPKLVAPQPEKKIQKSIRKKVKLAILYIYFDALPKAYTFSPTNVLSIFLNGRHTGPTRMLKEILFLIFTKAISFF